MVTTIKDLLQSNIMLLNKPGLALKNEKEKNANSQLTAFIQRLEKKTKKK